MTAPALPSVATGTGEAPACLAWAPDGLSLACGDLAGGVDWLEARPHQSLRRLAGTVAHPGGTTTLAWQPDRCVLATGGIDGTARLWSLTDQGPVERLTLLGLPEGWAALAPDGRYKREGDVGGQFWHVIGMCRFEAGDLNQYLPDVQQLPPDVPF